MRQIDFTPTWYLDTLKAGRTAGVRLGGLIAIAVLIAVWSYDATSRSEAAATELAELHTSLAAQEEILPQLDALEEAAAANDLYASILADVSGGVRTAEIVAELSHLLPRSVVLRDLRLQRAQRVSEAVPEGSDPAADKPALAPTTLEITAWSRSGADIGTVVRALSDSALFDKVTLRYERSVTVDATAFVEFMLVGQMPEFE